MPPLQAIVSFFEFADRHHAASTYDLLASQIAQAVERVVHAETSGHLMREAKAARARGSAVVAGGGDGVQGNDSTGPGVSGTEGARDVGSMVEQVGALWHATAPSEVAKMAKVLRHWASLKGRHLSQTDVWRNFVRDAEVRAIAVQYALPVVSMFATYGVEFATHRHGLHLRDLSCYDGLHPNHDNRAEAMISRPLWRMLSRGLDGARSVANRAAAAPGVSREYSLPAPLQHLPSRSGGLPY